MVKILDSQKIAFFDVDETLIRTKSMFDFMRFYLEEKNGKAGIYQYKAYWKIFKFLARMGVSRNKINTLYYWLYRGSNYDDLLKAGMIWYQQKKAKGNFLIYPVVERLKQLQKEGVEIVFVSGSFRPCLEPLAHELGVDVIICGELDLKGGFVSGRLTQQAIGKFKATLVSELMEKKGADPKNCYAFGDHISDLPMLEMVGTPVVISNCLELITFAESHKWEQIQSN